MKLRVLFSFAIILIGCSIYIFLQQLKKNDLQTLSENRTFFIEQIYNTSFEAHRLSALKEHHQLLENKEAISILKKFKYATPQEKKILRGKLYRLYIKHYKYLQTMGVKQFHFHTFDGKSLLRLHSPQDNGDSLFKIRKSIQLINTTQQNVYGFEGGKIFPGFRYIFPIIIDNDYLGSVEYSVSFNAIEKLMKKTFSNDTFILHLDKSISYDKVFKWFRIFFTPSVFHKGYYLENNGLKKQNISLSKVNNALIKNENFQYLFNQNKTFSIPVTVNNQSFIVSFLSIKDISNKHAAYLVGYTKNEEIDRINQKYFIFYIILIGATLFIVFLVDTIRKQVLKIVKQKTQLEQTNIQQFNQLEEHVSIIDKNVLVSSTDLDGNIVYVSDALCKMSGYTKEELIGKNHNLFRDPKMPKSLFKGMWKALEANNTFKGELSNQRKDGSIYWVKVTISPMYNDKKEKVGYTAIRQDITDKKVIEKISITDGLTKIYNRRHFDKTFPRVINRAKRHNGLVSFLIIDVDHFKQYNDTYGHKMGDEVLIEVATCIKNTLKRADDYCFRLGGEEFGVLFDIEDQKHAVKFANTIRRNIQNLHIVHNGNSASQYVTASVGMVCKKAHLVNNEEELYHEADTYLYEAKRSGRNKVISNITIS